MEFSNFNNKIKEGKKWRACQQRFKKVKGMWNLGRFSLFIFIKN